MACADKGVAARLGWLMIIINRAVNHFLNT
jgi:hypothetical protein